MSRASPAGPGSVPSPLNLAVSLEGKLPCAVCGYDLRGVSILGVCPECGTAVRATLLAVVDPLAEELRPIDRPGAVAGGLLVWVGGFCVAGLLAGWGVIRQVVVGWGGGAVGSAPAWLAWSVCAAVLIAGAGAALITRPHSHVPRGYTAAAWVAVVLHLPLAVIGETLCRLHAVPSGGLAGVGRSGDSMIGPLALVWEPSPDRSALRTFAGIAGLLIIVCVRPVTRVLVARSLAIRTGRVDRQTLMATAAAIVVVMFGDLLGLLAKSLRGGGLASEWMLLTALTLLAFGALLLSIGLVGSLIDAVRIARAIIRPGPSLNEVIHGRGRAGAKGEVVEGGRR